MVKICKASRLCSFKSCLKTHLCCDACKLPKKGQAAGVLWSVLIMLIVCMKQWEWGIKHPSAAGPTLLQERWGTLWLSLEVHVVSSLTPQSNGVIQPRCNRAWEFNFDQRIASLTGVEACSPFLNWGELQVPRCNSYAQNLVWSFKRDLSPGPVGFPSLLLL